MTAMRDELNAFLDLPEVDVSHAQTGPLAGFTLGVKDIFDVAGLVTGCGNPVKGETNPPAGDTAAAVRKLLEAGARFAGKTQTEELAFSLTGQNAHFPWPINPAAPGRVTGGSSSGSAAAVAGGLCDIATGSDTGGSIRAPASFCGLTGLRTTHGRIPLHGTMPLAPTFDTFGWFARDIGIYERVGEVLFGGEPHATIPARAVRIAALDALLAGAEEIAEYGRMAGIVAGVLGPAEEVEPPRDSIDELYWCLRKLQAREAWAAHGSWVIEPRNRVSDVVRDRFLFGRDVTDAEAAAESDRRARFGEWLTELLGEDGVLVLPTVPSAAPRRDGGQAAFGPFREQAIRLLCWSGLSGLPQITIPLGTVRGAPFGISLIGPANSDMPLIRLGRRILEAGTGR